MIGLTAVLWLAAVPADEVVRAHQLIGQLECDEALTLGRAIAADPSADEAEAREGRLIAGYCLAAVGRVSEAEVEFRAAVAEDVRVEAGFPMEHRVQFLLDAARADVLQERARKAQERRAALAAQVELVVEPPAPITGGQRASFLVQVAGPAAGRIISVKLQFRRPTDPEYYSLPVRRGRDGIWRGEIGGIYTGSSRAYTLQWFVTASDEVGELKGHGSREAPMRLPVAAGSSVAEDMRARERLPILTRLLFAGVGAPTAVTAAVLLNIAAASAVDRINPLRVPEKDKRFGMVALLATPLTMAAAEAATTMFLLDNDAALSPAIAVGVVGLLIDLPIAFAALNGANLRAFLPDLDNNGTVDERFGGHLVWAALLVTATVGAAATVPVGLIVWDASQYVE